MRADVVGTSRSLKHGVFIGVRPDVGMRHEHCVEVVVVVVVVFFFKLPSPDKNMLNIQICTVFYDHSAIQYDLGTSPKINIAKGNHHF